MNNFKKYLHQSKSFFFLLFYTFFSFYLTICHVNDLYFHKLDFTINTYQLLIITFIMFLVAIIINTFSKNTNLLCKLLIITTPGLIIDSLNFMASSFYPGLVIILSICIILSIFLYFYFTTKRKKAINIFNLLNRCVIVIAITTIITIPLQHVTTYIYEQYTPTNTIKKNCIPTINNQLHRLNNLEYKKWTTLNTSKKLDCLNTIIMIQSHDLGISQIPKLKTTTLKSTVLGEYRDQEQTIYINREYLNNGDPLRIVKTVLHEVRHAYQFAVVNSINWQAEAVKLKYFDLAKDYKYAMEHYSTTNNTLYRNNYLEIDARNYAKIEIIKYKKAISK